MPATRRRRLAGDTLVVVSVVLAAFVVLAMAWATRAMIVWVLTAGFLAFSIDPLAQTLRRKARVGRGGSIALATAVIGLVFFVVGLIVIQPVLDGANALLDAVPDYAERLEDSGFIGALFGIIGTLLALPITAAVKIVLEEVRRPQPAAS